MTLQATEFRLEIYKNGNLIVPTIGSLDFDLAVTSGFNKLTVTASATDEALAIDDLGDVNILELRVKPTDVGKVSLKLNSSTTVDPLDPLVIYSESITTLTGSNSSSSDVDVYWRAIYG